LQDEAAHSLDGIQPCGLCDLSSQGAVTMIVFGWEIEMITEEELGSAAWHKSTSSGSNSGCVSVAAIRDHYAVRDSKNAGGPALVVSRGAWIKFIDRIKHDEFALPPRALSSATQCPRGISAHPA
jgi:hypothetical protein